MEAIERYLRCLSREDYITVSLFFVEGLSVEEIVYVTGRQRREVERVVEEVLQFILKGEREK